LLIQQTVEQAALEHGPFSDLERRVICFTESGDCPEDPTALNDAFEAEFDSAAYEKKVTRLMPAAHRRLQKEDPEKPESAFERSRSAQQRK
jgi:hypothetical protein